MATLSIDLAPWLKRRSDAAEEARKKAEQDAELRRALALTAFGGAPGTAELDPRQPLAGLTGVTDTMSPQAGLAQQLANDRLEQQRQAALPAVSALMQGAALTRAGLDPEKMAKARLETLRGNALAENLPELTPAARVNAANRVDVSPVRSDGGVFYNRFDPQVPFIGMSEPAAALADQRWAASRADDARARLYGTQAADAGLRLGALTNVLQQPGLNPLLAVDVANKRTVSTPQRVKVKGEAGDVYYDATPRADGGFDYALATDAGGRALQVPVSESDARTALQKDTAFIAETLGMKPEEAILWKLQSPPKSDQQLSDEIGLRLISADPRQARTAQENPQQFRKQVQTIFGAIRPGVAAPAPAVGGAGAPPAPTAPPAAPPAQTPPAGAGAPGAAAGEDGRYAEARAAVASGADPARVRERLRSLGLDPNGL